MSAAERAFFDGDHCAHVAARDEASRITRKHQDSLQALRLRTHSPLRASRDQHDAAHLPLFVAGNEPTLFGELGL